MTNYTHETLLAAFKAGQRNFVGVDLSEADLSEANLRGANLREANLYGANLREADLTRADLREADLTRADLRGADLRGADLRGADLRWASLRGTDLSVADLVGCSGLYSVRPPFMSSRNDALYAGVFERDGGLVLLFSTGCQRQQTAAELREKVRETHGMNAHAVQYEAAITFIEACFASDMAEGRLAVKEVQS